MNNRELGHAFDTISSAGISIHLGSIEEAFEALGTLRKPSGEGWQQDVARATECLFRAKDLVERAESFERIGDRDAAKTLWDQVTTELAAARVPNRLQMSAPVAYTFATSNDSWPELLRFFEEYVQSRRSAFA